MLKTFTTKSGKQCTIRYITWDDIDGMLSYINTLSAEDTFITFSGEQLTRRQEALYICDVLLKMEEKKFVKLVAEIEGKIVGVCDVRQDTEGKKRSAHVGIMGLTVAKEFRGDGIGSKLMETTIAEASARLDWLKLLLLHVYSNNEGAIRLYERLGFREVGRIPGGILYKGEYVDKVTMIKE